jgi:translocation and assembly module TamB
MKRRIVIVVSIALALLVVLPLALVYFALFTQPGLRFTLAQLGHFKTVRMQFIGVSGTATDRLHVDKIIMEHERARIVAEDISTAILPRALLLQTISAPVLRVGQFHIEIFKRRKPPSNRPPRLLPHFLRIAVDRIEVTHIEVVAQNGYMLTANSAHASTVLTSDWLHATQVAIDTNRYTAAGTYNLEAADPFRMSSDLAWTFKMPDRAPWRGTLHANGDLDDLEVNAVQTAPIDATVAGRLLTLTRDWHWEGKLTSPAINFAALAPAIKVDTKSVSVNVRGDRHGIALDGVLTPLNIPTGEVRIQAQGPYPTLLVKLDAVAVLASGGARVDGHGELDFRKAGGPRIDLVGRATQFRWPLESASIVQSAGFNFSIKGAGLPYDVNASGPLTAQRVPAMNMVATGKLDKDNLLISHLGATWLGGRVTGQGRVDWGASHAWSIGVDVQGVNPGAVDPAWPGALDFRAAATGSFGPDQELAVNMEKLRGRLRGQIVTGHGGVKRRGNELEIDKLDIGFGDAKLTADGSLGTTRDLKILARAEHLEKIFPEASGRLELNAHLKGPAATARLTGKIAGRKIKYGSFDAAQVDGDADLDLSDKLNSRFNLTMTEVQARAHALGTVTTTLTGRASQHQLDVRANTGGLQLQWHVDGSYLPPWWHGTVTKFDLDDGKDFVWHLTAPAVLTASSDSFGADALCVAGASGRVCAQGIWHRAGPWTVAAEAHQVPLRALGQRLPTQPEYTGTLELSAGFKGDPHTPFTGRFTFDLVDGTLKYKTPSGRRDTLRLGNGHGELIAEPNRLESNLRLTATEQSFLTAHASAVRAPDWLDSTMSGNMHVETHELGFVPLLVPEIDRLSGSLDADLSLAGSIRKPEFNGAMVLSDGAMDLYQVNLLMRDMGARVEVAGSKLSLNAHTKIGAGNAQIAGELHWLDRKSSGLVTLRGENLRMVNVPEMRVDASPNLNFRIDGRRVDVGGSLVVPYARIKPADLTGAVLSSGDEVIVGDQPVAEEQRYQIYTDLRLVLGNDVQIETYGLAGRLSGSVSASSDPAGIGRGAGELKIEEGKYTAYGRKLDIERGRLIFSGGLASDPGVDIRAVKKFPDLTAGVNVRGKLRNPQLGFFSDPSLPQSQIVSILVAGGTIESLQTNSSSTKQVGLARNELLAQGGALVAQQIGARLGLEDISIESNAANQTSLVLGKFLNPRLYVSYGVSLAESINTVKLRYTLGDRWTIKTEAGENRSADLVYTIER